MTYSELFSKRYNLRPTPQGLIQEDVPESARIGLLYLLEQFITPYFDDISVIRGFYAAKRMARSSRDNILKKTKAERIRTIEAWLTTSKWWDFLDICELISAAVMKIRRGEFSRKLNSLFREENIGYEMQEGKIERIGTEFTDEQLKNARRLLKDQKFEGADEHFEKAIKALNTRPNTDVENCIKDAVSAIESVGRIIVKNDKALLSDIIKDMAKKGTIPKPLDQAIQKVYAYRGNEPGVAHGAVQASKVTVDEAEFVLAMSAAIIIYLVKKRSKLEQTI